MNGKEKQDHLEDEQRLLGFLLGDLSPEDAALFEKRLQTDRALQALEKEYRDALERAKDWLGSETPGAEGISALHTPSLSHTHRENVSTRHARSDYWRKVTKRVLAAAAMFLIGFLFGQGSRLSLDNEREPLAPSFKNESVNVERMAPTPARMEEPEAPMKLVDASVRRQTVQPDGRVLVETVLKETGSQALWVVDGRFRVSEPLATP
ncbi:MAG TPA: hypothetical protein PKH07_04940 [bacterium]|nr:hypothetical protein [bacterium]